MIHEIISLSWLALFIFGLKFLSAWMAAAIIVAIPVGFLKAIVSL